MEILLAVILVIGLSELRDWKIGKRHKELQAELDSSIVLMGEFGKQINAVVKELELLRAGLVVQSNQNEEFKSFISEAQVDLKTIVNEYEVNGIPLGFDRTGGQKFDMVEGL